MFCLKNCFRNSGIYIYIFLVIINYSGCSEEFVSPAKSSFADYTQIDFEPSWSFSGNKIAFAHSDLDPEQNGIYIINSDGSNKFHIVTDFARSPEWSPDENWLVYSQFNDLYKIKINGDSNTRLTFGNKNLYPKWSSDYKLIAYSSGTAVETDIFTIKPDGSGNTLIEKGANFPSWENGSNSLLYFKPIIENSTQTGDSLIMNSLNSGTKKIISVLKNNDNKINMYPVSTGKGIIFCSMNNNGYTYIYSINLTSSAITKLTDTQGYSPDFSESVQKIIYTNRESGNGRLWLMNLNGSAKIQLTFLNNLLQKRLQN